jgi:hypothetical protein
MSSPTATIVALVSDLIFSSRIRAAASDAGVRCRTVRTLADLQREVAAEPASLLVIDLDAEIDIESAVAAAKLANPGARSVGFVSHVNAAAITRARQAGTDEVMARSAFVRHLPSLVAELQA